MARAISSAGAAASTAASRTRSCRGRAIEPERCAARPPIRPCQGTVPGHGRARRRGLDGCGLLRLLARLQSRDQIRHVRELLLEIALVALEPLEDVLLAVPAAPKRRPAVPAVVSVTVHQLNPFP